MHPTLILRSLSVSDPPAWWSLIAERGLVGGGSRRPALRFRPGANEAGTRDRADLRGVLRQPRRGPKPLSRLCAVGGTPEVEVGIVLTVLTVDEALQHMCELFREQADRGSITPSERDLLIDGAVLLAMRVDDLAVRGHEKVPVCGQV